MSFSHSGAQISSVIGSEQQIISLTSPSQNDLTFNKLQEISLQAQKRVKELSELEAMEGERLKMLNHLKNESLMEIQEGFDRLRQFLVCRESELIHELTSIYNRQYFEITEGIVGKSMWIGKIKSLVDSCSELELELREMIKLNPDNLYRSRELMKSACQLESSLHLSLSTSDPESNTMSFTLEHGPRVDLKIDEMRVMIERFGSVRIHQPSPLIEPSDWLIGDKLRSIRCVGSPGIDTNQFTQPYGICFLEEHLYVVDSENHRLQVIRESDCSFVRTIGSEGNGEGQFNFPSGVTSFNRLLYVADSGNQRVQILSQDGKFVRFIGAGEGSGDGEFIFPWDLAFHEDLLFVSDPYNHRIQVFQPDGTFYMKFGTIEGVLSSPCGLCFIDELLFVTDSVYHHIAIFRPDGILIRTFGKEGSSVSEFIRPYFCISEGNLLFVSDSGNHRVSVFSKEGIFLYRIGSQGTGPNQLSYPQGMVIHHGKLFIVDSTNHRIQVFSSSL